MPRTRVYEAIHAAEHGHTIFPEILFGPLTMRRFDEILDTWRVRHLLRLGEPGAGGANPRPASWPGRPVGGMLWAYAATAWRLVGDPRDEWLTGHGRIGRGHGLRLHRLRPLDQLAETSRPCIPAGASLSISRCAAAPRRTAAVPAGSIHSCVKLRAAMVGAVEDYVRSLPPVDPRHPLLGT